MAHTPPIPVTVNVKFTVEPGGRTVDGLRSELTQLVDTEADRYGILLAPAGVRRGAVDLLTVWTGTAAGYGLDPDLIGELVEPVVGAFVAAHDARQVQTVPVPGGQL